MAESELELVSAEAQAEAKAETPAPAQPESPDAVKAIVDAARNIRLDNLRTRHEEAVKNGGPEGDINHIEAQIKAALGSREEDESGGVEIASGLDEVKEGDGEVKDLPGAVRLVKGILAIGEKPDSPIVVAAMNREGIKLEDQAEFLRVVQEEMVAEAKGREPKPAAAAAETGSAEIPKTPEAQGQTSITLESGITVNVGDMVQVLDINEKPIQVKVLSFDENGGSVQVEDFDATGKSAGGRGGNAKEILKGAKVIKA